MLRRSKPVKNEPRRKQGVQGANKSSVFSYRSNRNSRSTQTSRPRVDSFDNNIKVKNRNIKHIPTLIAVFVIIISIGYSTVLDSSKTEIKLIDSNESSSLQNANFYKQNIANIIDNSIFNHNKISINTKAIEDEILDKFPEIQATSISVPLIGRGVIVQISALQPSLIINSNGKSYLVGVNGRIIADLSDNSDFEKSNIKLIHVDDLLESEKPKLGDTILPQDTIQFINSAKYQLASNNIDIESIKLPAIANELHIKLKDKPYYVKFNLQNDVRVQMGSLFATMDKLSKENLPQPKEYIDTRIENRVYYK